MGDACNPKAISHSKEPTPRRDSRAAQNTTHPSANKAKAPPASPNPTYSKVLSVDGAEKLETSLTEEPDESDIGGTDAATADVSAIESGSLTESPVAAASWAA